MIDFIRLYRLVGKDVGIKVFDRPFFHLELGIVQLSDP